MERWRLDWPLPVSLVEIGFGLRLRRMLNQFFATDQLVWFDILILWLSGPALVTGTWLLFGHIVMPGALIRSSAIAAAATLYLARSRQVQTIYGLKPAKPGALALHPVEC